MSTSIQFGACQINLSLQGGELRSLGQVSIANTHLRSDATPWLPWFDTYESDQFSRFRLEDIRRENERTIVETTALSNPETMFIERRDSCGDSVLRPNAWGGKPLEARLRVIFEPAEAEIDRHTFTGFRYYFEYEGGELPIHRLIDRQTWELGGKLEGLNVVCRNLFDVPRKMLSIGASYSTVGLNNWASLLPGNLWARWSLMPAFDMQYSEKGVMLGWFDRVSLIRSIIETTPGEDWLRTIDVHYDTQSACFRTNPKTVLYSPDQLDAVDALNLWTRVHDLEYHKARDQYGMKPEVPPKVIFGHNAWRDFRFESTYEPTIELAAEFGADAVFIDPVWQNMETFRQDLLVKAPPAERAHTVLNKVSPSNMCCSLDFQVSEIAGGEEGLKALCSRAHAKGVEILSWIAIHVHEESFLATKKELGHGKFGIFAAKEGGNHPDTGYAKHCWTLNLNAPIYDYVSTQFAEVAERTGLDGYLWDSFSNLGWWQIDYSDGSMRPQFDKMATLFAKLNNQGLYIKPEAVVSFSRSTCCGCHGGDIYSGDNLGFAYGTVIGLRYRDPDTGKWTDDETLAMIRGERSIETLFRCFAHLRIPGTHFFEVPRSEWDAVAVQHFKDLFASYRAVRDQMITRTILKGDVGVQWLGERDELLWSFTAREVTTAYTDVITGQATTDLQPWRVYRRPAAR